MVSSSAPILSAIGFPLKRNRPKSRGAFEKGNSFVPLADREDKLKNEVLIHGFSFVILVFFPPEQNTKKPK
jgi:hypothetical protein